MRSTRHLPTRLGSLGCQFGSKRHPECAKSNQGHSCGPPKTGLSNYERLIDSGRYEPYVVKFFEGSIFDVSNAHRYTANEVYLDVNGKHNAVRLDSYNPGEAVVSRKFTQLAEQPRGAITALKEMVAKYDPENEGIVIADTPGNRLRFTPDQIGKPLDGPMRLEVPVQNAPVPQNILDLANEFKIKIVDVTGRTYS